MYIDNGLNLIINVQYLLTLDILCYGLIVGCNRRRVHQSTDLAILAIVEIEELM